MYFYGYVNKIIIIYLYINIFNFFFYIKKNIKKFITEKNKKYKKKWTKKEKQ